MWGSFRGGALEIHMDGQEQEWVQSQASMPPAKIRLKPYLGDVAEAARSLEALRLHVSGRTARIRQAGLDNVALHKAVQREIFVLALHGYPQEMMLRVWSRSRQYPAAAKHAHMVLERCPPRPGPVQAGLDLGHTRGTAVGGLTGRPLQCRRAEILSQKTLRCAPGPTGSLADGRARSS